MSSIGENIERFRKSNNMKQTVLADFLGISREMISYYENGKRPIPIQILMKLSDLFGVDLEVLISDEPTSTVEDLALAFRTDNLSSNDLNEIAKFKRIIKNYVKMKRLADQYGILY